MLSSLRRASSLVTLALLLPALTLAADEPQEVRLWPNDAPGSEGVTAKEVLARGRLTSVHQPSVVAYLPAKEKATGAAVIIAPGGGHQFLSIDHEGHNVGRWLSERGVAGFVLKYRLAREPGSRYKVEDHALRDAQRAIRLIRSRAPEWNVNPAAIGILGFSAGGEVAALAATRFDKGQEGATDPVERQSSRPDFQVLIYPGIPRNMNLTQDTPPALLLCAYNDRPNISEGLATLYLNLKKAGVNAELHIYAQGGHGFGLRDTNRGPYGSWPARLADWLTDRGFSKQP
jgi:endo-1,4-beta-xylanase